MTTRDERDVETVAEALWSVDRPPMWRYIADNHPKTAENTRRTARAVLDALDVPGRERRAKAEARKVALAEAIQAHRNLHIVYGSTAVCHGGIGGQMMTEHCGQTCDNPVHDEAQAAWWAVEESYFRAAEIDPEEGDHE